MLDFSGKGVSGGIGDGILCTFEIFNDTFPCEKIEHVSDEVSVFESAHTALCDVVARNAENTKSENQKQNLLQHLAILQDENIKQNIISDINTQKNCAEKAAHAALKKQADKEKSDDKIALINEICTCLLYYISFKKLKALCETTNGRLVIKASAPLYKFVLDEIKEHVSAVILVEDSENEEQYDILRHEQIAAIYLDSEHVAKLKTGERTLLDGNLGTVAQNPESETLSAYAQKRLLYVQGQRRTQIMKGIAATTKSGVSVELTAEVSSLSGARAAIDSDSEGIGILKSNLLRIMSNKIMSDSELYSYLRDILLIFADKDVCVTLPQKGEDEGNYMHKKNSGKYNLALENVFFDELSCWYDKLLACLLRTSAYGKLSILPLYVNEPQDLKELRKEIAKMTKSLRNRNFVISDRVKIGAVINTAASATITDLIAAESDFIVIDARKLAKNILQHRLQANSRQACNIETHPAVLRTIAQIIRIAQSENLNTGIFGFNLSEATLTAFIVGLRITKICALPHELTTLKRIVRTLTQEDCRNAVVKYLQLKG